MSIRTISTVAWLSLSQIKINVLVYCCLQIPRSTSSHCQQTQPACCRGPDPSLVPIAKLTVVYLHCTEGVMTANRSCCAEGKNNNQIFRKLISTCGYQVNWTNVVYIYAFRKHTHYFHSLLHPHSIRRPRPLLSYTNFTTDIWFYLCLVSMQAYSNMGRHSAWAAPKKRKYEENSAGTGLSCIFITHLSSLEAYSSRYTLDSIL